MITLKLLPPQEAIDYFRAKGYRIGFDYRDVWQQEHQSGFTVAKAMILDLLVDIRAAVDAALANGTTLNQMPDSLRKALQAQASRIDDTDCILSGRPWYVAPPAEQKPG